MNAEPQASDARGGLSGWTILWIVVGCVVAVFCLIAIVAALLLPAISVGRGHSRSMSCLSQMKQIALALHEYHDAYGSLPPAYVPDAEGRPMHSWRVLILPHLVEDKEAIDLYEHYDFSEPWDGPNNSKLAARMPTVFRCVSDDAPDSRQTSYVAVVGAETVWPGTRGARLSSITDGPANTILLVESAGSNIGWMEPRDLAFDEAAGGIHSNHPGGVNVVFCDAHGQFLADGLAPEVLRALLTARGDEVVDPRQLAP